MDFSENMDSVKDFISKQKADGGRDFPEDVQGGFHKALGMNWEAGSIRSIFHIADAPGHGRDINGCDSSSGMFSFAYDDYPNGSPDGFKL